MKAFKYICSSIIFAIASYLGYRSLGEISLMYFDFFILTLLCGVFVLFDGGRKVSETARKKH